MSLSRLFSRELRPMFRMFEDPLAAARPGYYHFRNHPFLDSTFMGSRISPAVDITESADGYVVNAEVPGVKKENIKVNIGEGGNSLTIDGRVFIREGGEPSKGANTAEASPDSVSETSQDTSVSNRLYSERTFVGNSSFSRTVQLPHPIDPDGVSAKLTDGILTIKINKLRDGDKQKHITIE